MAPSSWAEQAKDMEQQQQQYHHQQKHIIRPMQHATKDYVVFKVMPMNAAAMESNAASIHYWTKW